MSYDPKRCKRQNNFMVACYTVGLTRLEDTSAVLFVYILVVSFISTENIHDIHNYKNKIFDSI